MFKKVLSMLLAVMLVVSVLTVGVVASNAATSAEFTPDPAKIYFDIDGAVDADGNTWASLMGTKGKIAFYICGGDLDTESNPTKPTKWGAKAGVGTATAGETGVFEYNPAAKLGTLTPGVQYKLIFVRVEGSNWKDQTYDLFFTTDCLGHIAKCDGTMTENPVDSSKKTATAYWDESIDPTKNGPVKGITSIGNVVGSCVEQGKTDYDLMKDFFTEEKTDFNGKTVYQNAHGYVCEISETSPNYKTEQKLVDDIAEALSLTKDDVAAILADAEVQAKLTVGPDCSWDYEKSSLPGGSHTHTPGKPVQENYVPADCHHAGGYDSVIYCIECGEEISREHVDIGKLLHTPGDPVQDQMAGYPATCTEQGLKVMVTYCTECGDELSREDVPIPAKGHSDPLAYHEEVPATATVPGTKAHYECTDCHATFWDAAGQEPATAEELIIPAKLVRSDANGDGVFDSTDVTVLQRYLVDLEVETFVEAAADVDLDGVVDAIDVTLMQRVLAKMTTFEKWDEKHPKTK